MNPAPWAGALPAFLSRRRTWLRLFFVFSDFLLASFRPVLLESLPPSKGSSGPLFLGPETSCDVESNRSQVDMGGTGSSGALWGGSCMPPEGEPLQGMLASMSPSGNEDKPLALEGCQRHLCRLHLEQGANQPFSGQGPDLPPPLSLSHLPCPKATCSLCTHTHVSTCAHKSSWFREGRDSLQRDRVSPSVILFLWFSFQAVTVNLFYLSLCKSLCRIKPFTSF